MTESDQFNSAYYTMQHIVRFLETLMKPEIICFFRIWNEIFRRQHPAPRNVEIRKEAFFYAVNEVRDIC